MVACPPLEDIAAFIDDLLSPEERARITEHLARCESCYEIFAGAVHFQEEEGDSSAEDTGGRGVLPFPLSREKDRAPRRIPRWLLPLAASVVLTVGLGFTAWQLFASPKITVAGVAEPVEAKAKPSDLYQSDVNRGLEATQEVLPIGPSFMTGVFLVDLRPSLRSQDSQTTRGLLYDIHGELSEVLLVERELVEGYKGYADAMTDAAALRRLAPEILGREKDVQEFFSISEDPLFSFGLWTEAGRLAAVTQTREFFETRKNHRFLSHLLKTLPDQFTDEELQQPVLDDLHAIEQTWDEGELSPQDYQTLAGHFQKIIQRIDDYKEDLTSED